MKIISWNVNGLRACFQKGFINFIETYKPDILCLQETKAARSQIDLSELECQYIDSFAESTIKRGYSGTATFIRRGLESSLIKQNPFTKESIFDCEGRTVVSLFKNFVLINSYYPNGKRDHSRVDYKLEYSQFIMEHALSIMKEQNIPVILCGDFNTAHHEIDLKNPQSNSKTTGFLPRERQFLDSLIHNDFIDAFRYFHKDERDHYTWWTYRNNCRERNIGWRIDYFFVPKDFIPQVQKCYHLPNVMGSDHCPVVLECSL